MAGERLRGSDLRDSNRSFRNFDSRVYIEREVAEYLKR